MTQELGINHLNVGRHLFTFQQISQAKPQTVLFHCQVSRSLYFLNSTKATFLLCSTQNPESC